MPELPDITVYINALNSRIKGQQLQQININSPFLLRTVEPEKSLFIDATVSDIERIGKRIAIGFHNNHWLVIHLMIAGRLQWIETSKKKPARKAIAEFTFSSGTMQLTEAGTKRRASLHLFDSAESMRSVDRGGIEVLDTTLNQFSVRLTLRNHTLKRALTDQGLFSGIGNAYCDEILHHAGLSPVAMTQKLSSRQISDLYTSTTQVLQHWVTVLEQETGEQFPKKVTAFREGM
ncbi:MAG: DNA-formamidopyrimidine glycosylase family protein, partial [Pseudomonadota bacterium]